MDDFKKFIDEYDSPKVEDVDLFADAPPLKQCDGCGKYFEEPLLKRCRVCGKLFCPDCREIHDCRSPQKNQSSKVDINETFSSRNYSAQTSNVSPIRENHQTNQVPNARGDWTVDNTGLDKETKVKLYGTLFILPIILIIFSLILFGIIGFAYPLLTVIPVVVLVIGIIIFIREIVRCATEYYIISPNQISRRFGVINKEREDILMDKVDGTRVKRNLFDLIFGSGKIIIYSVGGRKNKFGPVGKPYKIQSMISDYVAKYQERKY